MRAEICLIGIDIGCRRLGSICCEFSEPCFFAQAVAKLQQEEGGQQPAPLQPGPGAAASRLGTSAAPDH